MLALRINCNASSQVDWLLSTEECRLGSNVENTHIWNAIHHDFLKLTEKQMKKLKFTIKSNQNI